MNNTWIFFKVSITWQPSLELGHLTLRPRISRFAKLSGKSCDSVIGMLSIGHLWSDSLGAENYRSDQRSRPQVKSKVKIIGQTKGQDVEVRLKWATCYMQIHKLQLRSTATWGKRRNCQNSRLVCNTFNACLTPLKLS